MDIQKFMLKAIQLSKESTFLGGGPFGAVIVKDNKIIGEGRNSVIDSQDPTAHAEIVAIRNACKSIASHDLSGAVIFTSCEPCPMCLSAIWWARIEKIYYGNSRSDAAKIGFDDEIIYEEITRPFRERKLPIEQQLQKQALKVFTDWYNGQNKRLY
jgi:tRNA(Arg) A34 adenosine deaminase TadA